MLFSLVSLKRLQSNAIILIVSEKGCWKTVNENDNECLIKG